MSIVDHYGDARRAGERDERKRIREAVRELLRKWIARRDGRVEWKDVDGAFRGVQAIDEVLAKCRAPRRGRR